MFRLNRNERSHWSGNGVHVESELVFMIGRNMHCKELDFNFSCNEHYLRGWGPLDGVEARELFALWQSNFIGYGQLGYFTVIVSGD